MEVQEDLQHQLKQQPAQSNLLASGSGPLLAYFHGKRGKSQTFFSLSENRYQVKNIPEMREKQILLCSHSWLFLTCANMDNGKYCFLLNPISMQKIQLPPWVRTKSVYRWGVLSLPPDNPKCIIMFIGSGDGIYRFMFCKPGDNQWTRQDLELDEPPGAVGVHNGEIYMSTSVGHEKLYAVKVNEDSEVELYDMEVDHRSIWEISIGLTFLVEVCGELLLVNQCFFNRDVISIRVFKLDFDKKVWIKIIRMNDVAIFLGLHHAALAYLTKESSGILRGNTIYFTQTDERSLYMYDLEFGSIEVYLPCANVKHHWSQQPWILPVHDEDK